MEKTLKFWAVSSIPSYGCLQQHDMSPQRPDGGSRLFSEAESYSQLQS